MYIMPVGCLIGLIYVVLRFRTLGCVQKATYGRESLLDLNGLNDWG